MDCGNLTPDFRVWERGTLVASVFRTKLLLGMSMLKLSLLVHLLHFFKVCKQLVDKPFGVGIKRWLSRARALPIARLKLLAVLRNSTVACCLLLQLTPLLVVVGR